jgi:hypothetical protein
MTTIQPRSVRPSPPKGRTARRRAATALLCAAGWVAAVAYHGSEPTATPDGTRVTHSSASGGVSQMSVAAEGFMRIARLISLPLLSAPALRRTRLSQSGAGWVATMGGPPARRRLEANPLGTGRRTSRRRVRWTRGP